jgi:hypothetical protein
MRDLRGQVLTAPDKGEDLLLRELGAAFGSSHRHPSQYERPSLLGNCAATCGTLQTSKALFTHRSFEFFVWGSQWVFEVLPYAVRNAFPESEFAAQFVSLVKVSSHQVLDTGRSPSPYP